MLTGLRTSRFGQTTCPTLSTCLAQSKRNVLAGRSQSPIVSFRLCLLGRYKYYRRMCALSPFSFFFLAAPPVEGMVFPNVVGFIGLPHSWPPATRAIVADHVNCTVSATRGDDGNAGDSCECGEGRGRWKDSSRLIDFSCRSGRSYQPPAAGRRQASTWSHLEPLEAT